MKSAAIPVDILGHYRTRRGSHGLTNAERTPRFTLFRSSVIHFTSGISNILDSPLTALNSLVFRHPARPSRGHRLVLFWDSVDSRLSTRHTRPGRHGRRLGTDLGKDDTSPRGPLAAIGDCLGKEIGYLGSVDDIGAVLLERFGWWSVSLSFGDDKVSNQVDEKWGVGRDGGEEEEEGNERQH